MEKLIIITQIILVAYAIVKALPLTGFYSMKTCLVSLVLGVIAFTSLVINQEPNAMFFVSIGSLLVAITSCYGIKPPKFPCEI